LVATNDTLINLDYLDGLVSVDAERKQVTVQAGIRLKALNALLPQHGLALANLGSIAEQSIAGAISTGTHGTGIRYGSLSTQVVALTLVTAGGQRLRVSAEENAALLPAARLSLGALGVITEVTLQCVPAFNLVLLSRPVAFDEALEQIASLNQTNDRVRMYWFPGTEVIYLMTINDTDQPVTPRQPVIEWFQNVAIRHDLMAMLIRLGHRLPDLVDRINQFETRIGFVDDEQVDRGDRVLTVPMPPRHQECEYAVPYERTVEAIRVTRKIIEASDYKASIPVEIRFVAADDNMLSPAYGGPICYIGAYTYGETFARPYFQGFEIAMKRLGGRPHWGKRHSLTSTEARAMYPLFDRFGEVRRELDPHGTFANPYLRDLFEL
jgi:FAD-linked oxidoreductase